MAQKTVVGKEYYEGSLIGGAIGDALGMPLEFLTRSQIQQVYGRVTDYRKATSRHPCRHLNPGQYTDDTQMMLALTESIVESKGFDPDRLARKFIEWYLSEENNRAPGCTCSKACKNLLEDTHWKQSGIVGSAGCGTAMRAAPLGLLYRGDQADGKMLLQASIDSSIITHYDPRAVAGTMAVASAVAYVKKQEPPLDIEDFIGYVTRLTGFTETMFTQNFDEFVAIERLTERIVKIPDYLSLPEEEAFEKTGNSGYVLETVPAAFLAFLRSPEDFEETVVMAVNAGGDADSIGIIAGAISGAYNGIHKIPQKLVDGLEKKEKIKELADQLYILSKD